MIVSLLPFPVSVKSYKGDSVNRVNVFFDLVVVRRMVTVYDSELDGVSLGDHDSESVSVGLTVNDGMGVSVSPSEA